MRSAALESLLLTIRAAEPSSIKQPLRYCQDDVKETARRLVIRYSGERRRKRRRGCHAAAVRRRVRGAEERKERNISLTTEDTQSQVHQRKLSGSTQRQASIALTRLPSVRSARCAATKRTSLWRASGSGEDSIPKSSVAAVHYSGPGLF
jgi:hypothetical protein